MAYDLNPEIELMVSDVRETILFNLEKRFKTAGILKYKKFITDLSFSKSEIKNLKFKIILCDVPCTGSGTWSRTPEQLYFFNENKIEDYASLQKKIVSGAIPHLRPGGSFIYITCSVFKKENEDMVDFIKEKFQLEFVKMELLKGYDKKADSMFVAVLQKPL
jgi:16S rRNA (cytosine967-C5)-methyltransferase